MTETTPFSQIVRQWMDTFMHRSMGGWARYIKARGFSMPQFFLLMHIYQHEQCGISDLRERMDTSTAAVSQLVDKLVQAGLIERAEDPNDRRAKKVALTPQGKQLIEQGIEERYRWVEQLEANLTETEKDKISKALTLIVQAEETIQ